MPKFASLDGTQTLTQKMLKDYKETVYNDFGLITSDFTVDLANGNIQSYTLPATGTNIITFPSAVLGMSFTLLLYSGTGDTGSVTFAIPNGGVLVWHGLGAPTLILGAAGTNTLTFLCVRDQTYSSPLDLWYGWSIIDV